MSDATHAQLLAYLDAQRRHVLTALDGLSDEQLRRPALPSGWSCLGLVRHLSLADEHYWFRCVMGGEPFDFFPSGPRADWMVDDSTPAEVVIDAYKEEIRQANAVISATALDAPPAQRDPMWDEWGMDFPDLRDVLLHMIVETAVHAGHLDAARELLDGHQHIVL